MAALIGLVVGALIGGLVGGSGSASIGGLVGFVIGVVVASRRERKAGMRPDSTALGGSVGAAPGADAPLSHRVAMLERRVVELERMLGTRGAEAPAAPADSATTRAATIAAPESDIEIHAPAPVLPRGSAAAPGSAAARSVAGALSPDGTQPTAANPEMPAAATPADIASSGELPGGGAGRARAAAPMFPRRTAPVPPNPVWAWLVGGNTLARIGVLLLFIGVGFLLKYAVEHVHVPISVRLAGVALGGVALLVLGWRLRLRRRAYAMVLQGGGVGVLYLTVFAALKLYALVAPVAAFGLLFWISALSSWLAIRQDAISLAALAVLGGFLAPILTSTDSGNHVMLFSYYALLNAGILGIAWFKAWRSLNLLGFVFTFLVGTFWGVTRYRPEHFATTEPFLVLFFLFYVAIAVLYALRRSVEVRNYVDAGLVFGTPLVAAGLQSALVRDIEYAMAYSALAMSAVYLVLGRLLYARHRDDIRLLVESFLALGIVFATLAVPLGLDARWTSAAWAIEGAAIVWAGIRQQRIAMRGFGLLLEFGAGAAFMLGLSLWVPASAPAAIPVANSAFVGAVLVAIAGLFSAWQLQRSASEVSEGERTLSGLVFAWGMLWWLGACWREIDRWLPQDVQAPAVVALLAVTAAAFFAVRRRLQWPMARMPALLLLPALGAVAVAAIREVWYASDHVFAHGGYLAWPFAVAVAVALLHRFDRDDETAAALKGLSVEPWHAGLFWLVLLLAAHELAWVGGRISYGHGVWTAVPWGLVPAMGLAAVCALASGTGWPVGAHRRGYLVLGGVPVALLLVLWSLAASVHGDGDPAPLQYFPFANPLDVTQAIVLTAGALWALRVGRVEAGLRGALPRGAVAAVLATLVFLWINAIALRSIHFWYDVPYTAHALWRSALVQATLSLLWSTIALATMALANRRQWRTPWMTGAALLAVVVAKLFLVELAQVGTITRIVSFIGVGLLLLLIGYLAPVPPRKEDTP